LTSDGTCVRDCAVGYNENRWINFTQASVDYYTGLKDAVNTASRKSLDNALF